MNSKDKYQLDTNSIINLLKENGQIIASFDDIEAFAYAGNEFEAVDMLCQEIILLYEELSEDKENLGPLPRKWLSTLENFTNTTKTGSTQF